MSQSTNKKYDTIIGLRFLWVTYQKIMCIDYFVRSGGNVTDEVISEYIRNHNVEYPKIGDFTLKNFKRLKQHTNSPTFNSW